MWSWNTFCSCFVAILFLFPGSVIAFILHSSPSLRRTNKFHIVVQNPCCRTFGTCRLNDSLSRTPNHLSHQDHDDLSSQAKDRKLYEMLLQEYHEMLEKGSSKHDENPSISSGDKSSTGNNYIVPSRLEKSKSIKTDKLVIEGVSMQKKSNYYAVIKGHKKGIFFSWSKCEEQVNGYPGAHFKSFPTEQEAKAFLNSSNRIITATSSSCSSSHQPSTHFFGNNHVVKNSRSSTPTVTQSEQLSLITSHSNLSQTYQVIIQFDGGSRGNPGRSGSGAVVLIKSNTVPTTKTTTTATTATTTTTTNTPSTISTSQTWYARSFLPQNATNNEAEYNGVIVGLTIAVRELKKLTTVSQHNNDNNSNNSSSASSKSSAKPETETEDKERPYVELIVQGDSKLVIQQLQKTWKVNKDSLKPYYNEAIRLIEQEIQPDECQFLHVYREENRLADQLANEAMDTGRSWYSTSDDNHEQEMPLSFRIEKAGKDTSGKVPFS